MTDDQRQQARAMAKDHLARGDATGWFEVLYGSAAGDAGGIPWADLAANPHLVKWLDARGESVKGRALVVGCGLGDDAEELARRGFEVTAFDIAPTAVAWCRRRFPETSVKYVRADLLEPPPAWRGAFDLVVEAYTLQALPAALRTRAVERLAGFLAPAGELLVICRGRTADEPEGELPWPLMEEELEELTRGASLRRRSFEEFMDEDEEPPVRRFRAVYARGSRAVG